MSNQNDVIHVALAVYDPKGTYSMHAGVVMVSIFENAKSRVLVHKNSWPFYRRRTLPFSETRHAVEAFYKNYGYMCDGIGIFERFGRRLDKNGFLLSV
ncbi:MAG: hypothetical protein LBR38_05225 [Synergistaceae bacterium]|nr:hypothetical protein [Synergistaceae bacterium]